MKLPEKNQSFSNICLEKLILLVKFPGKIDFLKFAWKNQIFVPGSMTPHI